jgi:two-component system alkaline phosphatase synthesis response regulator PhoP
MTKKKEILKMPEQLIYIVEDDENIRKLITYALENSDYVVNGFNDGASFFAAQQKRLPNLIILDIMLPDEDGLSILQKIKNNESSENIPVIMLTAKTTEYDIIKGLDMGADDYIKKPFSVLELISRVKAILRRHDYELKAFTILEYKDLQVNLDKRLVYVADKPIQLTYKEFELLAYLLHNQGIVLSREKIISHVWELDFVGETRTVDMHIKTLRQKLGKAGSYIETVRSVGYKIGG